MANQQLIDYIRESLSAGISLKKIEKSLLDAGWPEQEVKEVISGAKDISPRKETPPLPEKSSQKTSILAILSLIFAFLFPLVGLILGIIALSEIKKNPSLKGRGLAIAGVIISSFFVLIYLILLLIGYSTISGYLNPGTYIPSSCMLGTGLSCSSFKVDGTANTIALVIRNGMGEDLNPFNVLIAGACDGSALATDGLVDGEEETLIIDCANDITESKFKENIVITYTGESGLPHSKTGSILAQVK